MNRGRGLTLAETNWVTVAREGHQLERQLMADGPQLTVPGLNY